MGNIGFTELLFIFVIALLIFGPRRLPELGRSLGKGLAEFKRATTGVKDSIEREIRNAEMEATAAASAASHPNTTEAGTDRDAPTA